MSLFRRKILFLFRRLYIKKITISKASTTTTNGAPKEPKASSVAPPFSELANRSELSSNGSAVAVADTEGVKVLETDELAVALTEDVPEVVVVLEGVRVEVVVGEGVLEIEREAVTLGVLESV